MKLKYKLRKLLNIREFLSSSHYLDYVDQLNINENAILLESQHGTSLSGNIFYLLKELCLNEDYKQFEIYVSVDKKYKKEILKLLKSYSFNNYKLVNMKSDQYYKIIATSKYLINDNTFLPFFIKRDEQVYLNTWHGTPLKTLGKKINNDFHNIGNPMKNFFTADYLLYPNEYTKNVMIEDYMLENISKAKVVLDGYPRNNVFFDKQSLEKIRYQFHMNNKKIIAYMPTWRGTVANKDKNAQIEEVMTFLKEMDNQLDDNSEMYVNFHPIIHADISFSGFKKIKSFPREIETYEFLNACDILVTDYSSVFFDFAITRKKIILFTYDKEEYFSDRGVYMSIDTLPFPQVNTVNELLKEIYLPIHYNDEHFINEFCCYDKIDSSKEILDLLLFNQTADLKISTVPNNGKENVLIYAGNFAKNGITSSLFNLLENIDTSKRNYYVTFYTRYVHAHRNMILSLPEDVKYIPMLGKMNANLSEKKVLKKYYKSDLSMKEAYPTLEKIYSYEIIRKFGSISFSNVIHFTGYEFKTQLLFSFFKNAKKIIYVHSNMIEEIKTRQNQHIETLKYSYSIYDKIAIVTKDMFEPTKEIAGTDKNFVVASNLFDYKTVKEKALLDISFDENTESNFSQEQIIEIVKDKSKTKFINIGRFSPEKGHKRLIMAFDRIYKEHPDAYLIIIGGHGPEYEDNIKNINNLKSKNNIILIKSMTNPYTILKYSQCFAFTSFYEGLGLVMLEADSLGVPVFSTDILGPHGFIQENGGNLVENSENGIYKGFKKYYDDELKVMNVDYDNYNANAIREFEDILA